MRGQAYSRQVFVREYVPFEWRPTEELRKRYEEPLELLNKPHKSKQSILLEFMRDEEVETFADYPFKFEQNTVRKLTLGNARLMDIKLEKNANYELVPKKDAGFFECDNLKGTIPGGQEIVVKFIFKPPKKDVLLQDIGALRGLGQWVESVWECRLSGGFINPGEADAHVINVTLRAYVEQI